MSDHRNCLDKKRRICYNKKAAGMVELADTMDLGDVTLVKGFCAILAADILR